MSIEKWMKVQYFANYKADFEMGKQFSVWEIDEFVLTFRSLIKLWQQNFGPYLICDYDVIMMRSESSLLETNA